MSPSPHVPAIAEPTEEARPPHAERPIAASPSPSRRRLRRAARLSAVVVALVATGAGCKYEVFGATPRPSAAPAQVVAAAPAISGPEAAIREVFGPLGVADMAVSVAACESGLNPGADSGTYKGLFQLGPQLAGTVAFYGGDWFDPMTNSQVARDLYLASGWSSWPACGRR
jgi:hypothetical protein